MTPDIEKHERAFYAYAAELARKSDDDPAMILKITHTRKVVEYASHILSSIQADPLCTRSALLGALYHDVGRFEQYLRYGTFRDAQSCNHGQLGVRIIKKMAFLAQESVQVRRNVLAAVLLHNRFALPADMGARRIVCEIVRDADKLDILRIIDEHLNSDRPGKPTVILWLPDTDAIWSTKVIDAVLDGVTASYADLRTVNDFRLLLGTWYNDLSFAASRQRYVGDGHARRIILGLPAAGPYEAPKKALLGRIFGENDK